MFLLLMLRWRSDEGRKPFVLWRVSGGPWTSTRVTFCQRATELTLYVTLSATRLPVVGHNAARLNLAPVCRLAVKVDIMRYKVGVRKNRNI